MLLQQGVLRGLLRVAALVLNRCVIRHPLGLSVPEAQRFTNALCCECGARVPRPAAGSGMVLIPMESPDVDP